jgi:hypothetical protein
LFVPVVKAVDLVQTTKPSYTCRKDKLWNGVSVLHAFSIFCMVHSGEAWECLLQVDFACSSSSNIHARQIQQCFRQTIINAKFGGHMEATRRVLSQLPISAQSYTSSPYVDLSLFSYDDKWVSVLERPKQCGDHPIRYGKVCTSRHCIFKFPILGFKSVQFKFIYLIGNYIH